MSFYQLKLDHVLRNFKKTFISLCGFNPMWSRVPCEAKK